MGRTSTKPGTPFQRKPEAHLVQAQRSIEALYRKVFCSVVSKKTVRFYHGCRIEPYSAIWFDPAAVVKWLGTLTKTRSTGPENSIVAVTVTVTGGWLGFDTQEPRVGACRLSLSPHRSVQEPAPYKESLHGSGPWALSKYLFLDPDVVRYIVTVFWKRLERSLAKRGISRLTDPRASHSHLGLGLFRIKFR
jgi:hypothetical protein